MYKIEFCEVPTITFSFVKSVYGLYVVDVTVMDMNVNEILFS